MTQHTYYSESDLLDRLTEGTVQSDRQVVFLVGSPIAAPDATGTVGVPSVDGIIDLIRQHFKTNPTALAELGSRIKKKPLTQYQEAFSFLQGRRGQDVANEIIRKAVLAAHERGTELSSNLRHLADNDFRSLESRHDEWYLPRGILSLGRIVQMHPTRFGKRVLTSNFDPLIELGIARAGGVFSRTVLPGDGSLTSTEAAGCNVVHFHGYWYGSDTLHTPLQLRQPRKMLRASLGQLLDNTTVVVLAYGGWDDIFTDALIEVVGDHTSSPDVLWTFHEADPERIEKNTAASSVLRKLSPGFSRGRVTLYSGIDCHDFLEKLQLALGITDSPTTGNGAPLIRNPAGPIAPSGTQHKSPVPAAKAIRASSRSMSDSPPRVDAWVGRKDEFSTMETTASPVIVVTGFGGQGKSALAATYVKTVAMEGNAFESWDWRDCREQGDRLNTQISSIIERISDGALSASELDNQDIDTLTGMALTLAR